MPTFLISELAERVDAQIEGSPDRRVTGVAPLRVAGPEDLAFLADDSPRDGMADLRVGALLASTEISLELPATTVLRVDQPRLAFARLLPLFFPEPEAVPGLHATVVLGRGVQVDDDVTIEAHTVVEDGAVIGAGSRIGPCTRIGRGARVGQDCRIAHSVSILPRVCLGDRVRVHEGTRIGTEGFAYVPTPDGAHKIPQVGGCVIGDDVEIGANCTIDRGALGDTSIGARTKIDNLVHLAHNVIVGEDCFIAAQVGFAGSVTVDNGAQLGGQAGVAGHLTIGAGARIAAQSGVMRDVPAGETHGGYPAQPQGNWMRMSAAVMRLPKLIRRLNAIERRLGLSEDSSHRGEPDSETGAEGASE